MKKEIYHVELEDYQPLDTRREELFIPILVDLLNQTIDERNRCYDGVVNQRSNKVEDEGDRELIEDMDNFIFHVIHALNKEYLL